MTSQTGQPPSLIQPVEGPAAGAPKKSALLPETTEGMPWPSSHEIKKESNPFTDPDRRMWLYAWSGMAVRVVVVLGGIFGGLFTLYEYLETSEAKRIDETYKMIEIWEQPENQTAQQAIRERLAVLNTKYRGMISANPSPSEIAVLVERLGIESMTGNGGAMPLEEYDEQFARVVSFLNRLASCVFASRCSRKVTDAYFGEYFSSFWSYFGGYARETRAAGSPTYMAPIEQYVTGRPPNLSNRVAAARR